MARTLRGLTVDNGGSEVRTLPLGRTVSSGMTRLANDFVTIDGRNYRAKDADDKLGLCRVTGAPKDEYLGIIAQGNTGKLYDGKALTIDSQSTKTGNVNYYKQFIYAVARDAIQAVLDGEIVVGECIKPGGIFKRTTYECNLDPIEYVIVTCIPIKEHSGRVDCASKLKENLAGKYVVEFPLLGEDVTKTVQFVIKQENIGVVPEGAVAMTQMRSVQEDDITLVVDMGHVSTDLALFKGKTLLGNRVISSQFAGSTLIANVRAAMSDEGYFLNEEQTAKVVETGKVKNGAKTVDVFDIVAEQKKLFVKNYLASEVVQLLNMNAMNAKQVTNVVPIGAPMNGVNVKSSIAGELVRECGLSAATVQCLAEDLRYVNIEQASKFTSVLYRQASVKAAM